MSKLGNQRKNRPEPVFQNTAQGRQKSKTDQTTSKNLKFSGVVCNTIEKDIHQKKPPQSKQVKRKNGLGWSVKPAWAGICYFQQNPLHGKIK
jgi:hypothetical protein